MASSLPVLPVSLAEYIELDISEEDSAARDALQPLRVRHLVCHWENRKVSMDSVITSSWRRDDELTKRSPHRTRPQFTIPDRGLETDAAGHGVLVDDEIVPEAVVRDSPALLVSITPCLNLGGGHLRLE